MIAVITSTVQTGNTHSFFSNNERLIQTLNTIDKLEYAGFEHLLLFDNSLTDIDKNKIAGSSKILTVFHSSQYSFTNKGLNEAHLLLNNLHNIPANTPIFKISGRYSPSPEFKLT
jgi:hypothetical protein